MKDKLKNALTLFLTFFKIGAFTFGGGYAMIPLIQKEVVDNIAYFESVSGIQSNVLISAEDVAMAASPTEEMNTEENTENEEDTNTSEVATEKNTEECTTEVQTEESNIEESESVEESSETELTSEEKTEDESDKKIFGVGFDATVTYDIVKDVDKKDSKKSEAEKEKGIANCNRYPIYLRWFGIVPDRCECGLYARRQLSGQPDRGIAL